MSTAASIAASVLGGLVGSAPGWAGIYLALRRQTAQIKTATAQQTDTLVSATDKQTHELKAHITGQSPGA